MGTIRASILSSLIKTPEVVLKNRMTCDIITPPFVPRALRNSGTLKLIPPFVHPSVCHKNFNLGHNLCSINGRAFIFGMHDT